MSNFCKALVKAITFALLGLSLTTATPRLSALEKQPTAVYHARRQALAKRLQNGLAILFAGDEPLLDFMPYRQDEDFYYLTGWNEPSAALVIAGDASSPAGYKEYLFLPTRDLRMEKYTGVKLDAATPNAPVIAGVDTVLPMTELPAVVNKLIDPNRRLMRNLWTIPASAPAKSLLEFTAATFGTTVPQPRDLTQLTTALRITKDAGEAELLQKAATASVVGQRELFKYLKPGVTERMLAGKMIAGWMAAGCERPSYAPIVGTGINTTVLHYSDNSATVQNGDLVLVDAACEYSMYASDITRTLPANGHFTPRQREIYNIVLGAHEAAAKAFVAGKSKINDRDRLDPDSLDTVAYNYINSHGKDLHGNNLGIYWLHGMGHMVGIDVHDPADYPAVLKPGMVFTIEPGVYIPEEKIGVRIECTFLVGPDGKLIDLTGDLPHSADEIEAAMAKAGN